MSENTPNIHVDEVDSVASPVNDHAPAISKRDDAVLEPRVTGAPRDLRDDIGYAFPMPDLPGNDGVRHILAHARHHARGRLPGDLRASFDDHTG